MKHSCCKPTRIKERNKKQSRFCCCCCWCRFREKNLLHSYSFSSSWFLVVTTPTLSPSHFFLFPWNFPLKSRVCTKQTIYFLYFQLLNSWSSIYYDNLSKYVSKSFCLSTAIDKKKERYFVLREKVELHQRKKSYD